MKYFFICLVSILLVACATSGPKYTPAPEPPEGEALVYFLRGDVHYGGGYSTSFFVDDKEVAKLHDWGYSWIHLSAGMHEMKAGGVKHKIELEAGKTYYFEYHQDNKYMPTGERITRAIFTQETKESIAQQIGRSRYRPSIPLDTAKTATRREYRNIEKENSAKLTLTRKDSFHLVYPGAGLVVYNDPMSCVGGHQRVVKPLAIENIFLDPGKVTLGIYMGTTGYLNSYISCDVKVTLDLEANKEYEMKLNIFKEKEESRLDSCSIDIVEKTSQAVVPFLVRTKPLQWTGKSPKCSKNDFTLKKPVESYSKQFECAIYSNGKKHSC